MLRDENYPFDGIEVLWYGTHRSGSTLGLRIGLQVELAPFDRIVERALTLTWTSDGFDRIIVAHAQVDARPLVSKDTTIRKNYAHAVW
jgi:hypothetical protein